VKVAWCGRNVVAVWVNSGPVPSVEVEDVDIGSHSILNIISPALMRLSYYRLFKQDTHIDVELVADDGGGCTLEEDEAK
jgi:hypothetical protein